MKPLLAGLDPRPEPVTVPSVRLHLHKHDPCCLHEQDAQVAITALRYPAEDRAISSRDLLRHKPQPCSEVTTLGETIAGPDRGHHRARDDRSDAWYARQPLASGVPFGMILDLAGQALDALIEPAPVRSQFLEDAHHAG